MKNTKEELKELQEFKERIQESAHVGLEGSRFNPCLET
jgi:hypothetical protein